MVNIKREYYEGFSSTQQSQSYFVKPRESIVSTDKDFEKDHSLLNFRPEIVTQNKMLRKPRPVEAFFHHQAKLGKLK